MLKGGNKFHSTLPNQFQYLCKQKPNKKTNKRDGQHHEIRKTRNLAFLCLFHTDIRFKADLGSKETRTSI